MATIHTRSKLRTKKTFLTTLKSARLSPSFALTTNTQTLYKPKKYKTLFLLSQLIKAITYKFLKPSDLIITARLIENAFVLNTIPDTKKQLKILDFGASTSLISLQLAHLHHQITVVDMRKYEHKHKNIKSITNNILNTKFRHKFDVIIALSSIEHAGMIGYTNKPNNNEDLLIMRKFKKILKPKGIIILTIPYGDRSNSTNRHRVYDDIQIKKLTKDFKVKNVNYFKQIDDLKGNICLKLTH